MEILRKDVVDRGVPIFVSQGTRVFFDYLQEHLECMSCSSTVRYSEYMYYRRSRGTPCAVSLGASRLLVLVGSQPTFELS